jgi:hypothetical protein
MMRTILTLLLLLAATCSHAEDQQDTGSITQKINDHYHAAKENTPLYWDMSKTWATEHWHTTSQTAIEAYTTEKEKIKKYFEQQRSDGLTDQNAQTNESNTLNDIKQQTTIDPIHSE